MPTRSSGISRSKTSSSACDAFRRSIDSSRRQRRLREPRGLAAARARHRRARSQWPRSSWARVNRPNVMIKIPGTKEGAARDRRVHLPRLNINVTLIFSVEMYEKAARAYVKGLERRARRGQADRQDSLGQLGLRQPDRHGHRQAAARAHRQRRKARAAARQDRRRRPQADLSKVQEIFSKATRSQAPSKRRAARSSARSGRRPRPRIRIIPI